VPPLEEIEGLIRSLVEMVRGGGISELDVAVGRVSIRLRGIAVGPAPPAVAVAVAPVVEAAEAAPEIVEHVIAAPMIGTYYGAPSPSDPPFVEVGDAVEAGQTVGIIEAMKIMNEITADRAGVVTAILVGNGQPVEYGSPLIRLRAAGDQSA
jgi:acetyl-CoA carboxylase biotin carboxyl carrier protein